MAAVDPRVRVQLTDRDRVTWATLVDSAAERSVISASLARTRGVHTIPKPTMRVVGYNGFATTTNEAAVLYFPDEEGTDVTVHALMIEGVEDQLILGIDEARELGFTFSAREGTVAASAPILSGALDLERGPDSSCAPPPQAPVQQPAGLDPPDPAPDPATVFISAFRTAIVAATRAMAQELDGKLEEPDLEHLRALGILPSRDLLVNGIPAAAMSVPVPNPGTPVGVAEAGQIPEPLLENRPTRVLPVDAAVQVTMPDGSKGPRFNEAVFNSSTTFDFDRIKAKIINYLKLNVSRGGSFSNPNTCVRIDLSEALGPEALPWLTEIAKSHKDRQIFEAYIALALKRGTLARWERDPNAPHERPPGLSCRVNMFATDSGRVVLNLAPLNQLIDLSRVSWDLPPDLAQLVNERSSHTIFAVLDLIAAYDQVRLDVLNGLKIFVVALGETYQLQTLPMGLITSPAIFHNIITSLLHGIANVKAFFDDLIAACNFKVRPDGLYDVSEYEATIDRIFERLNGPNGFRIRPEKCSFFVTQVVSGGWLIGGGTLKPSPAARKAVADIDPYPKTVSALRRVLGLLNVFSAVVPDVSRTLGPAFTHTGGPGDAGRSRKGPLRLTEDQREAIATCIRDTVALVQASNGVSSVNWDSRFTLRVDACLEGSGGVLMQWVSDNPADGLTYVAFASSPTSAEDGGRSASAVELKGLVTMLQKFEFYLRGRSFDLWTDHMALVKALAKPNPSRFIRSWWEYIMSFSFRAFHVPGSDNILPDALSRLYDAPDPSSEREFTLGLDAWSAIPEFCREGLIRHGFVPQSAVDDLMAGAPSVSIASVAVSTAPPAAPDPVAQPLTWRYTSGSVELSAAGEVIAAPRDTVADLAPDELVVPPEAARSTILHQYHGPGHHGTEAMIRDLRYDGVGWEGMSSAAQLLINTCQVCQQTNMTKRGIHPRGDVYSASSVGVHAVADLVDLGDGFDHNGTKHTKALIIADVASRYSWGIPIPDSRALTVARALLGVFLGPLGFPQTFTTDNGTEFTAEITREVTTALGAVTRFSSPWNPRGNTLAEMTVKQVTSRLRKLILDAEWASSEHWPQFIPMAVWAYNTSVCPHTLTPPFVLFTCRPRPLLPATQSLQPNRRPLDPAAEAELRLEQMEWVTRVLQPALEERIRIDGDLQRIRREAEADPLVFRPGDQVRRVVRDPAKLGPALEGPFTVVSSFYGTYTIADKEGRVFKGVPGSMLVTAHQPAQQQQAPVAVDQRPPGVPARVTDERGGTGPSDPPRFRVEYSNPRGDEPLWLPRDRIPAMVLRTWNNNRRAKTNAERAAVARRTLPKGRGVSAGIDRELFSRFLDGGDPSNSKN